MERKLNEPECYKVLRDDDDRPFELEYWLVLIYFVIVLVIGVILVICPSTCVAKITQKLSDRREKRNEKVQRVEG